MEIALELYVNAPLAAVWNAWITPEDITNWNYVNDEWCCPAAEINLSKGGKFSYRMETGDGSMGFDFEGRFTDIQLHRCIAYNITDGRRLNIEFIEAENGVRVVETFAAEGENPILKQSHDWLSILANFKNHVESKNR